MGHIWGRQDPGGPHVGLMKFVIWVCMKINHIVEYHPRPYLLTWIKCNPSIDELFTSIIKYGMKLLIHSQTSAVRNFVPYNCELVGCSWWRHLMEIFSALPAICGRNSPVTGEFPAQRPVTRSFDVFFDLHPNKRLSKQWRGWWFETLSCALWRHRNIEKKMPTFTTLEDVNTTTYIGTSHDNVFNVLSLIQLISFSPKGCFILYNDKNTFCFEKGVFYWASNSAISVEKGGFFSSKIRERGCFSVLGTSMIYTLWSGVGVGSSFFRL